MADRRRGADPAGRIVAATGRRLYLTSFALVALLVVGIGITTVLAALDALDSNVDRAVRSAAEATVARLGGELPVPQDNPESDDVVPGSADTFVLTLDPKGRVVADPSRVALPGLPVVAALPLATGSSGDLRTVLLGGISVRLLTLPVGSAGHLVGYVQAGFVLTLHDSQATSLVLAIGIVGVLGLLAAALITLLVTRRALQPIRRTFAAQLRFVADASHELRTPAAVIRATAEVLQRESLVAPDGVALVDDIVAESDRVGRLVGDLLALSSTGASDLVLVREPLDLAELVRSAVRRVAPLADERQMDVVVDVAGSASIDGDRDRLVQLVLILVDNAIDHAPAGSAVEVTVARRGADALLSVTDHGPGIEAEDRERIFEPFARLDPVARRRTTGAGLGLAIARRIVEAHGGRIRATAGSDGGARFEVTVPARR